jgi:hypothetical protein
LATNDCCPAKIGATKYEFNGREKGKDTTRFSGVVSWLFARSTDQKPMIFIAPESEFNRFQPT